MRYGTINLDGNPRRWALTDYLGQIVAKVEFTDDIKAEACAGMVQSMVARNNEYEQGETRGAPGLRFYIGGKQIMAGETITTKSGVELTFHRCVDGEHLMCLVSNPTHNPDTKYQLAPSMFGGRIV